MINLNIHVYSTFQEYSCLFMIIQLYSTLFNIIQEYSSIFMFKNIHEYSLKKIESFFAVIGKNSFAKRIKKKLKYFF